MMRDRKNQISLAVMVLLLIVTLWVIFRDQDLGAVVEAIRGANPWWLLLGLGLLAGFIGSEGLSSFILLRTMGHKPPYRYCYAYSTAGYYFSSITPSATGGQPAQVFYMTRTGISAAHGALNMLLLTVSYQVTTVLYALAAWVFCPGVTASLGTGLGVLLGYGFTATTLLTSIILLFFFCPAPARFVCDLGLRIGAKLHLVKDLEKSRGNLAQQMEEYSKGSRLLRSKPYIIPILLCTTGTQMTCLYLIPWAVYNAFGLSGVGPVEIVATQALIYLAVSIIPVPGSVGPSEAAFISGFQHIFTPALTSTAMLVSRSLSFYIPLVLTGIAVAFIHIRTAPKRKGPDPKTS